MAYKIVESQCTACSACEAECPNVAIREKNGVFIINPKKCTECLGHFDSPQCVGRVPGRRHLHNRHERPALSAHRLRRP